MRGQARAREGSRAWRLAAREGEGEGAIYNSMPREAVVKAMAGTSAAPSSAARPFAIDIFLVSQDGHLSGAATQYENARRRPQSSVRTAPFPSLHLTAGREDAQ